MPISDNVKVFRLFSLIVLVALPILLGWDVVTSNLLLGKFIDFTVPENLQSVHSLVWHPTSTWNNAYNGGNRNTFAATIILQNLILYGPIYFFESTWLLGRWCLLFPLAVYGVSYFIFFEYFIKFYRKDLDESSTKSIVLESLILSILFTYTNFNFNELHYGSSNYVFSCGLLPAAIAIFHKGCLENKIGKTALISLILTCVAGGILQNLAILILFYSIIIYFLRPRFGYVLKYMSIFALLSMYWIMPVLLGVSDVMRNQLAVSYLPDSYSMYDIFANRIYGLGSRVHYENAMPHFMRGLYHLVSGLFLLLPVYLLINNRIIRHNKFSLGMLTLVWLLVFTLFLLKGQGAPFGELNNFLFANVKLASLFRTTNRFWPVYYICLALIYSSLAIFRFRIATLLIFTLVISGGWFVNQDFGIANLAKNQPTMPRINLYEPNAENSSCQRFIDEDGDFKVLTKPMSGSVRFINSAGLPTSQGLDASLYFGGKSYFNTDALIGEGDFLNSLEYKMYTDNKFLTENANILRILGVKYFLIRKDVVTEFSPNRLYSNANTNYSKNSDLFSKVYSDDYCEVFQFAENFPTVYTLKTAEELSLILDSTLRYTHKIYDRFQQPRALNESIWTSEEVTYSKLSDAIYKFDMRGVSGSVPVFLNVNFSEDWIVIPRPGNLVDGRHGVFSYLESLNSITHFRGPMHNNGWIIDVDHICQNLLECEVTGDGLYLFPGIFIFKPQLFLFAGGLIFCCVVLWLLLGLRRS